MIKRKRCLWIINHKTLMPIEVGLLSSFGFEVYMPKIVPNDPGYRSAVIDYSFDHLLTIDGYILGLLNRHRFYEDRWSPTFTDILNENFDLLISSFSGYTTPLFEAVRKFQGVVVARVFGREHPAKYSDFFPLAEDGAELLSRIQHRLCRFYFGQAFDNLYEVERDEIKQCAIDLPVGLPKEYFEHANTWVGSDASALCLCPNIADSPYYGKLYHRVLADFGALPLKIFGKQISAVNDPRVLPYLSDADLIRYYQNVKVMIYPSLEPRHLHYSPLEAMIIGTPVLYLTGGLLERLAWLPLPGACRTADEMRVKAERLLSGDRDFAMQIKMSQKAIIERLSDENVYQAWSRAMQKMRLAQPGETVAVTERISAGERLLC